MDPDVNVKEAKAVTASITGHCYTSGLRATPYATNHIVRYQYPERNPFEADGHYGYSPRTLSNDLFLVPVHTLA